MKKRAKPTERIFNIDSLATDSPSASGKSKVVD